MRVGITVNLNVNNTIFSNGLGQNAIFLYDVLFKIENIENVSLVNLNKNVTHKTIQENSRLHFLDGYDLIDWNEAKDALDVLITLGTMPAGPDVKYFRRRGGKVIGYKGGNNLILGTEDLLFEKKWSRRKEEIKKEIAYPEEALYDAIWMVPQQEFHNKDYFEIAFKAPSTSVPFVWSPKFIEERVRLQKKVDPNFEIMFDNKEFDKWRVACVEPNTSILKNMMTVLHIMEWGYTRSKNLFKKFNITNADLFRDHPILIRIATTMEMQKDKKLGFDPRWNIVKLLGDFAEMIVSHQWGNPLNYAYLDTVWFGYPLIHNAELCPDIGYYYKDFNLKDAGELMIKAAKERKSDNNYTERHRKILKRYTFENQEMVNQYEDLLNSVVSGKPIVGEYDWKTNLIKY